MRAALIGVLFLLALGCKGDLGDVCTDAAECKGDAICSFASGSLTKQCTSSCGASCEIGECVNASCVATCSSDSDCPAGTVCAEWVGTLACQPPCEADDECRSPSTCSDGVCR